MYIRTMKTIIFLLINFIVGFVSDIILNDLSRKPASRIFQSKIIRSLRPYFIRKSIIQAAIYAGITVVIVLLPTIYIFNIYFDVFENIFNFILLSFCMGYIADILIDKLNIFGKTLKPYYNIAGSGLWGGMAIMFSVIISYIIQFVILNS
jgi:hypothetical protein